MQSPITISTTRSPAQDSVTKTSSKELLNQHEFNDGSGDESASSIMEEAIRAELKSPSVTLANPLVNDNESNNDDATLRYKGDSIHTTTDEKASGSDLISRSSEDESNTPSKSEAESHLEASSSSE